MTELHNLLQELWELVEPLQPEERYAVLSEALGFRPAAAFEPEGEVGMARALLSTAWERLVREPIPFQLIGKLISSVRGANLRAQLWIATESVSAAAFSETTTAFILLVHEATAIDRFRQRELFGCEAAGNECRQNGARPRGVVVNNLDTLVKAGQRFRTIYVDPPWPYENEAARGAAANHYPVMALEDIRREPVPELAEKNSHLHLWATNGFLREALDLIDAWGFKYKSCFVWVKPELGCGNYWRVSHEFLLLGVRGRLPFRDRAQQSWLAASRLEHSRKPGRIRLLIEAVSPGPYLELFGRAAIPDSDWTVFGNQVERRLF